MEGVVIKLQTGLIVKAIGVILLPTPIPDFGITFFIACTIALFIPKVMSEKVNNFLLKIPLIGRIISWSMKVLRKLKIDENLISRIIIGYLFTTVIGLSLIVLSYFL